jgi:hypothetical protein
MSNNNLVEPGVYYFLEETLKKCKEKKWYQYNIMFNGFLFSIFFIGIYIIYQYKKNFNKHDKIKIKKLKQTYFLDQIKKLSEIEKRRINVSITNLPKFENDFVQYGKKFI